MPTSGSLSLTYFLHQSIRAGWDFGSIRRPVPLRKRRTSLVGWKFVPITPTDPFKWRHFSGEVILLCVRRYLRYPLAYKHVSELLAKRGVAVDPTCIWRWVQTYGPS